MIGKRAEVRAYSYPALAACFKGYGSHAAEGIKDPLAFNREETNQKVGNGWLELARVGK
jgi:hypothetical protein